VERELPYNCEHVVPQSQFDRREPMRGDLHHLFACESRCNSFRGKTPTRSSPTSRRRPRWSAPSAARASATGSEPAHDKGPAARAVFYFCLRYPGAVSATELPLDRSFRIVDERAAVAVATSQRGDQVVPAKSVGVLPSRYPPKWGGRDSNPRPEDYEAPSGGDCGLYLPQRLHPSSLQGATAASVDPFRSTTGSTPRNIAAWSRGISRRGPARACTSTDVGMAAGIPPLHGSACRIDYTVVQTVPRACPGCV
jgi:hypothetical protein